MNFLAPLESVCPSLAQYPQVLTIAPVACSCSMGVLKTYSAARDYGSLSFIVAAPPNYSLSFASS